MARTQGDGEGKKIRIRQVRSEIGYAEAQRRVLRGLGLNRLGRSVVREDTPSIRGMCNKIRHLVEVEPVDRGDGR